MSNPKIYKQIFIATVANKWYYLISDENGSRWSKAYPSEIELLEYLNGN
jgi:hypothetical protein